LLGSRSQRGLAAFARAASAENEAVEFDPSDLPEWKARTLLVLCGRTNDAVLAQQYARNAVVAADETELLFLRVLARVTQAELSPRDREESLSQANGLARTAGLASLSKSIIALRADKHDIGMLQPYVEVRLRKIRAEKPILDVRFFTGEVFALGRRIVLRDKESELIFTVALSRGAVNADALTDTLWPESDGDSARNSFYVCLHRLRKQIDNSQVIRRTGQGYTLHTGAVVDLWQLESGLAAATHSLADNHEQLLALAAAFEAGRGKRATVGSWFLPFDRMLARKIDELYRLLAASRRESPGTFSRLRI
jgi:hypothetical protein